MKFTKQDLIDIKELAFENLSICRCNSCKRYKIFNELCLSCGAK